MRIHPWGIATTKQWEALLWSPELFFRRWATVEVSGVLRLILGALHPHRYTRKCHGNCQLLDGAELVSYKRVGRRSRSLMSQQKYSRALCTLLVRVNLLTFTWRRDSCI